MTKHPLLRAPILILGLGSLILAPLTSAGALGTGVGQAFTPAATALTCGARTTLQSVSVGNSSVVPTNGVITSWRFVVGPTAPPTVAFRLGRSTAGVFSVVGAGPALVSTTPNNLVQQDIRIPARAGDVLGMFVGAGAPECSRAPAGYSTVGSAGDVTTGVMPAPTVTANIQLDVAATLEPDADADGFGDLTQDLCSTDATLQTACTAGDTTITGKSANKKRTKVRVSFTATKTGSTFQCAVDSPVYYACTSPFTVKGIGKHKLAVRAVRTVGTTVYVDQTPATIKVKVKGPRNKK